MSSPDETQLQSKQDATGGVTQGGGTPGEEEAVVKCGGKRSPVVQVIADLAAEEKTNSYLCVQLYPGKPRFTCGN